MDRINGSAVSPDLFGAGKDGFKDGNKALGIAATIVNAEFLNSIQEELANVIEGQGILLDVANKTQLKLAIERMISGGDYKASVRVASTAAINLAAPGANIDGVAIVAGDRFLEKDNATAADRGIYIWNGAAVPATRALDADTGAEFNGGAIIPVEEGTVNADTNWQLTNNGTVTIGTTGLTFQLMSETVTSTTDPTFVNNSAKPASTSWIRSAMGTLAVAAGFAYTFTSNGYIKFPSWFSGFIIQWGFATASAAGSAVTFPLAFPNAFLGIGFGQSGNFGVTYTAGAISTTAFTFYNTSTTGSHRWIAFGY